MATPNGASARRGGCVPASGGDPVAEPLQALAGFGVFEAKLSYSLDDRKWKASATAHYREAAEGRLMTSATMTVYNLADAAEAARELAKSIEARLAPGSRDPDGWPCAVERAVPPESAKGWSVAPAQALATALSDLHALAGRPSTRSIAKAIGAISHTTVVICHPNHAPCSSPS
jgi:hypothetical protein